MIDTKIDKARTAIILQEPFYGMLILKLNIVEDASVGTAATNGKTLYYAPDFIKDMTTEEVQFILLHEVMHCALFHLWRAKGRNKMVFNMACDYAIHSLLVQGGFKILKSALYNSKYNDMSAEQIYEELMNDPDTQKQMQQDCDSDGDCDNCTSKQNDGTGSSSSCGKTIDNHSKWEEAEDSEQEGQNDEYQDSLQKEWETTVVSAVKQAQSSSKAGKIPGYFNRMVNELTNPIKDWRILLREFIEPEPNDYTFVMPDNRFDYDTFGCFLPSFNDEDITINDIYFWVDTSGSIDDTQLNKIYSEVVGAVSQFDRFTGYLGFFDYDAYAPERFEDVNDIRNIKPKGGGGTNFHAPFEYMNNNNIASKCNIILTDGYCSFPDENIANGVPTIWLITEESMVDKVPWGQAIYLSINQ